MSSSSQRTKLSLEQMQQGMYEPRVLGPFSILIRCTGFQLPTKNRSWATSLPAMVICLILLAGFILKFLLVLMAEAPPLTLRWADDLMMLGLTFYGLVSAICLALWTRSGFVDSFQKQLAKVRNLRVLPNEKMDVYKQVYLKGALFGPIMIVTYVLTTFKGILYPLAAPNENSTFTINYPVSQYTLFGLAPIIFVWMGVASYAATVFYSLSMLHLQREFNYFNEELEKAAKDQQLAAPGIFAAYGRRHHELMQLLKFTNAQLGKFGAAAIVGAVMSFVNQIFILISFSKETSIPALVAVMIWNNVVIGMIKVCVDQPAQIQQELFKTTSILMDDETIPTATDPRIQHSYRMFLDRYEHRSVILAINVFAIDRNFMHKVLMIAPNLGTFLGFVRRFRNE